MAFTTGFLGDPENTGAGLRYGTANIIIAADNYEDGLRIGRFAKWDTDRLDNYDGGGFPVKAGVVLNQQGYPVDIDNISDLTFSPNDKPASVQYLTEGVVSVFLRPGDAPDRHQTVFIINGGGDAGKATVIDTGHLASAQFIREIIGGSNPVWLIQIAG